MLTDVPVEAAAHNLGRLLESMELGQTVRVVGPDGEPLALVVSLRGRPAAENEGLDWDAAWDALSEKVGKAWKSEKSAVEIVSEMRE